MPILDNWSAKAMQDIILFFVFYRLPFNEPTTALSYFLLVTWYVDHVQPNVKNNNFYVFPFYLAKYNFPVNLRIVTIGRGRPYQLWVDDSWYGQNNWKFILSKITWQKWLLTDQLFPSIIWVREQNVSASI